MKALSSVSAAIALVSVLLLGVAGVAEAKDLSTAPLGVDGANDKSVSCNLVNPTAGAVNVTIEIFNAGGVSVAGPIAFPGLGAGLVAAVEHFPFIYDRFYCKFTTNNSNVRTAIIGGESGIGTTGYGDNR